MYREGVGVMMTVLGFRTTLGVLISLLFTATGILISYYIIKLAVKNALKEYDREKGQL